jgi:biotin synthase-like enzyme
MKKENELCADYYCALAYKYDTDLSFGERETYEYAKYLEEEGGYYEENTIEAGRIYGEIAKVESKSPIVRRVVGMAKIKIILREGKTTQEQLLSLRALEVEYQELQPFIEMERCRIIIWRFSLLQL